MNTFRKILGAPFYILGVLLLSVGLVLRFGLSDATKIIKEFGFTIERIKLERGE